MSTPNKNKIDYSNIDATPLFKKPQELEKTLYCLTQPNNAELKKATFLLREFLSKPESVSPLIEQIEKSQKTEVRQIAAVYLREQIEEYWKKIPNNIKGNLKKFLLKKLLNCETRAERLSIGAAISSIGKYSFINNKKGWNELLLLLQQICNNLDKNEIQLREIGYVIWRNLISFCGGSLKKHFNIILKILKNGLNNENNNTINIQIESLKSIGNMVEFLENENEIKIIENIIPNMVGVIERCLKKGDENNVISGMEVFNDLIESKIPVLNKHSLKLTKFMLKIASAKDELPMPVRKQATNYSTWMCKSKPKLVIKHNLVQPFLTLCINLIIESQELENEDNNNENENKNNTDNDENDDKKNFLSPLGIACDLLDEIFLNIPSETCFPIAIKAIEQLLRNKLSKQRKSAYVMMAMMAEGCKEIISKGDNLNILIKACLKGINDDNNTVRKCALEAITQFSTHLHDKIINYHKIILPQIFKIFERNNEDIKVKERALGSIEMFLDAIDYDNDDDDDNTNNNEKFNIKLYLNNIMTVIGKCLETKSIELQKQSISTLSSVAISSKLEFKQYMPKVMQLLESLLQIEDENKIELRVEATSCLGAVASAVGIDIFRPVLPKFHSYVMKGLQDLDYNDIREASFMYFSDLSEIMGQDILKLPSFQEMLDFIFITMEDDDGLMVELPDDGFGDAIPKQLIDMENELHDEIIAEEETKLQNMNDEELQELINKTMKEYENEEDEINDEDEDDENDNNNNNNNNNDDDDEQNDELLQSTVGELKTVKLNVTTGFMEEKASAVHALTSIIKNGKFGMLQYMEECWERLIVLWEYPHQLVKMAVASCFHEFFILVINHSLKNDKTAIINDIENDTELKYNWKSGEINTNIKYNNNILNWINNVFPMYIQSIREEEEKDALNVILDYFIRELIVLGPQSIQSNMDELILSINLYLKESTQCQSNSDIKNEDTKDIITKHKWITDTIAELIATLAELWGIKFIPIFIKLFPNLLTFAKPSRHKHDQAMVVGCIADICGRLNELKTFKNKNIKGIMNQFSDTSFKLSLRIAQSQDINMRQNALYCIGSLFTACSTNYNEKHFNNCLRCVKTFLQFNKNGDRGEQLIRDNAISAFGKMLISEPKLFNNNFDNSLNIFLNSLPLTKDFTENQYIYDILMRLFKEHNNKIKKYLNIIILLLGNALSDKKVPQKITNEIIKFFKIICKDENIQNIIKSLNNNIAQNNIMNAIKS